MTKVKIITGQWCKVKVHLCDPHPVQLNRGKNFCFVLFLFACLHKIICVYPSNLLHLRGECPSLSCSSSLFCISTGHVCEGNMIDDETRLVKFISYMTLGKLPNLVMSPKKWSDNTAYLLC